MDGWCKKPVLCSHNCKPKACNLLWLLAKLRKTKQLTRQYAWKGWTLHQPLPSQFWSKLQDNSGTGSIYMHCILANRGNVDELNTGLACKRLIADCTSSQDAALILDSWPTVSTNWVEQQKREEASKWNKQRSIEAHSGGVFTTAAKETAAVSIRLSKHSWTTTTRDIECTSALFCWKACCKRKYALVAYKTLAVQIKP